MLLDERLSAYNELIVEYREAADHLRLAGERASDQTLKRLFIDIADDHTLQADMLSELVRRGGALPRAQNIDREDFKELLTQVRAALSEDERQVLVNDRYEHEVRILQYLEDAALVVEAGDDGERIDELRSRQREHVNALSALVNEESV